MQRGSARGAMLLLAALSLAVSAPALRNGFVYDDVPVARDDDRIRSFDVRRIVTMPYWQDNYHDRLYRPVTSLSLAFDHATGGGAPFAFHLTNLLLNCVVVLLVYLLARRAFAGEGEGCGAAAFVGAAIFAVHPVHVEAVAPVVGRSELLAAGGYLGALLAARAAAAARGPRALLALAAVAACAAVAYGSKEHALTLPAALAVLGWWEGSRRNAGSDALRAALPSLAVSLAIAAAYLAARHAVVGTAIGAGAVAPGLEGLDIAGRVTVMLPAIFEWARLLFFPLRLSADYSPDAFAPSAGFTAVHWAALAAVAGVAAALWRLRLGMPALALAGWWFLLTMTTASNIPVATGVLLAERTLYLPSVALALLAGALWLAAPPSRARFAIAAVLIVLYAARTLERTHVWRDNDSFFLALARDAPASYRVLWYHGARAFEAGNSRAGEEAMLAALRINPRDAALLSDLGYRYLNQGRPEQAERFLAAALRVDSLRGDATAGLLLARVRAGRAETAAAAARVAAGRFAGQPAVQVAAFTALLEAGFPLEALTVAERLSAREPGRWEYHQLAADAAYQGGDCASARRHVRRAGELAPREQGPRDLAARIGSNPRCGESR
jgi:Flp pilus assembly protein TadD